MMQKDYILRMIQQLSRVLIQILHLREIKDYEGALTYIDDVFKQALGFSSDLITSVPDETLLAMFTSFDVLEIEPESSLVDRGIAFYERLLRKKDTELVAGNFSWEEAREGLAQLKNMHS